MEVLLFHKCHALPIIHLLLGPFIHRLNDLFLCL